MNAEEIRKKLKLNEIPFRDDLPDKLYEYLLMLKDWNSRMDLTAVTDDEETVDKHFVDSLAVLKTGLIAGEKKLIDVGTGAGFPGMVLAIARPDLRVTLLDSQRKRLTFLEEVIIKTQTENTILIHARAEEGARKQELREKFDYAAARALAPLNVLCEYLLPYVRPEGFALCWKGPALKEETTGGRAAAQALGGKILQPVMCPVYGREWDHMILPIYKIAHTPETYPRKPGTPKSHPIGG